MYVCGIDTETSGLDAKTERITEIGAVIFNTETWESVDTFSSFVSTPGAQPLSPKINELTGITDDMLVGAPTFAEAIVKLQEFTKDCKYFIAHNATFDKSFVGESIKRHKVEMSEAFIKRPWLCSKSDLEHEGKKCLTLSHLALDYGVAVDPEELHRALADVSLMGQMLQKAKADPDAMHAFASVPWVYLEALLPKGGNWEKAKEEAKDAGYGWEKCKGTHGPTFPKRWVKRVKDSDMEKERNKKPLFYTRVLIKGVQDAKN